MVEDSRLAVLIFYSLFTAFNEIIKLESPDNVRSWLTFAISSRTKKGKTRPRKDGQGVITGAPIVEEKNDSENN